MGYIHLTTQILETSDFLTNSKDYSGCLVNITSDANVLEFMSAAAAILVEAESRVPAEARITFRADFMTLLNNRRKSAHLC